MNSRPSSLIGGNNVLYVRLLSKRNRSAVGEETDDGYILLRDDETDEPTRI